MELALKLHGTKDGYRNFTIQSMKDHVDEIRMLMHQSNAHWKAETTDLYIHCLLLLISSGVDTDEMRELLDQRLERFQEKISDSFRDKEHKTKFREGVYGKEDSVN